MNKMSLEESIEKLEKEWNNIRDIENKEKSWEDGKWLYYPDYYKREEIKSCAWGLIHLCVAKKDFYRVAWYLLHGIITCHYWKVRQSFEARSENDYIAWMKKIRGKKYYKFYRFDIDHYTEHWLWANGDRRELFPKEVIDSIKENFHYESKKCKYLSKGYNEYWNPTKEK